MKGIGNQPVEAVLPNDEIAEDRRPGGRRMRGPPDPSLRVSAACFSAAMILSACLSTTTIKSTPSALSAPPTSESLRVGGAELQELMADDVFSSWNGGDPNIALKPGVKVEFFGVGASCDASTHGGKVMTSSQPPNDARTDQLTGIFANAGHLERYWSPSGDTPGCSTQAQSRTGESYVQVNADNARGGIGLYTYSGPGSDHRPAFFGPFTAQGQDAKGANAHIEGNFVNFRQAWFGPNPIHPWGGLEREALIRATQSVVTYRLDDSASAANPAQVKQEMIVTLINLTCSRENQGRNRLCQLQYLFNTAIYRYKVNDWTKIDWFQRARVSGDPGQGGMLVVDGPIDSANSFTREGSSNLSVYESRGAPTQHGVFRDMTFEIRISFPNLVNAVRAAVATELHKSPGDLRDDELALSFGSAWNNPNEWVLLDTEIAQEVFNQEATQHYASIGGNLTDLTIRPL